MLAAEEYEIFELEGRDLPSAAEVAAEKKKEEAVHEERTEMLRDITEAEKGTASEFQTGTPGGEKLVDLTGAAGAGPSEPEERVAIHKTVR